MEGPNGLDNDRHKGVADQLRADPVAAENSQGRSGPGGAGERRFVLTD
ncbi:MAG: hypothetical protein AAGI88_15890 [Pseudomonadota bacterium]